MRLPRKTAAAVPFIAVALVATACGGGGGDSDDSQERLEALAASDLNPHERDDIQDGGIFRWGINEYPAQFNMAHTDGNLGNVKRVVSAVMPSATRFDDEGGYAPNTDYVLDYELSEDGLSVEYTLNPDAAWSTGDPITWEDYEATVITRSGQRDGDFELGSTVGWDLITEFEEGEDDYSFTLHFEQPYAEWPTLFSSQPLYPKEYMEDEELFADGYRSVIPVTAGPFGDVEFDDVAETITVNKDEDWWGNEAKLDAIIFDSMGNDALGGVMNNGEIDGFYLGTDTAAYELLRGNDDVRFTEAINHGHRFIQLNGSSPKLEDVNVRHAVALGLDREAISRISLEPINWPTGGETNRLLRSSQNGFQDNSEGYGERDLERAAQLLDEAGWILEEGADVRTKDGEELELDWVASDDLQTAQDEASLAQDMLSEVGVRVNILSVPGTSYFPEYVVPGNYEMASYVLTGSSPYYGGTKGNYGGPVDGDWDGDNWGNNLSRNSTPEIDAKYDEANAETDLDRYAEIANEIDRMLWENVQTIPLFERVGLYAVHTDLANWGEYGLAVDYVYEDIGWVKD